VLDKLGFPCTAARRTSRIKREFGLRNAPCHRPLGRRCRARSVQ
jgi:hypothetical protein